MRFPLVLLLAAVCGCEQSSENAATTKGDVTVRIKPDPTVAINENEIPKDFPLPVYPNSKVERIGPPRSAGDSGVLVLSSEVAAPVEKVLEFYKKVLKEKGFKVTRIEMEVAGEEQVTLLGQSDQAMASIVVPKRTDNGKTSAMISWSTMGDVAGTLTSGDNVDVKDFPLPVFPKARMLMRWDPKSDAPGQMRSMTAKVSAPIDEVVKFYEKALKDKGLDISTNSVNSRMGDVKNVIGRSDKLMVSIIVSKDPDGKSTMFSVYWGKNISPLPRSVPAKSKD